MEWPLWMTAMYVKEEMLIKIVQASVLVIMWKIIVEFVIMILKMIVVMIVMEYRVVML